MPTATQFFGVFAAYNLAVWPAQLLLLALALLAVGYVVSPRPRLQASRTVALILGLLWLWVGAVYDAFYFTISPAGLVFGVLFVLESALLIWAGFTGRLIFRMTHDVRGWTGAFLITYALLIYPVLGYLAGQRYPATPTFGAPCPTTIFTLGMLLWAGAHVPKRVVVIPVLWSLLAVGAISLGVWEDAGLLIAGLITVSLLRQREGLRFKTSS